MAEADAKDRDAAEKLLNILDGVTDGLRVAGAIRKEDAIRLEFENVFGGSLRGDDPDIAVVIDEKPENILLDAEIVGRNAKLSSVRDSSGFAHGFRPRRNGELDGAFFPAVRFFAGDAAGEFLASHRWQLFGLKDQLLGRRAIGGNDATKRADVTNVADECARVDIPDGGNLVSVQIELRGFRGAPVRGDLRKLADDERFDIGTGGFFVVEICANVADVRIRQTDDLAGIARVGENFLITGEAGIENDFAAAARDGPRGAAVKYATVFQSESGGSVLNFGQFVLPEWSSKFAAWRSFGTGFRGGQRAEMIDRPVGEDGAAVNKLAGDGAKNARVIRAYAMVAHHEVTVLGDADGAIVAHVFVLCGHVRLVNRPPVDVDAALAHFHIFAGQTDDALDERFRVVERIPENDDIGALESLEGIKKFVYEDAFLIGEKRGHAGALDFYRLGKENNGDEGQGDGDEEVAGPNTDFVSKGMGGRWRRG